MTCLVDCPDSRRGEWSFHLFNVLVRVKFWFWIVILIMGGEQPPVPMLIWVSVCFGSILLHEFGHILAFRLFGVDAEVVLYGWGGLAVPRRGYLSPIGQFVVSLAGPAAGFVLVAVVTAATFLFGGRIHLSFHMLLPALMAVPDFARGASRIAPNYTWYLLVNDLLWVNFYWGLLNLLPIWPLDGGQATRVVFEQRDPDNGRRKSLILSAAVAGAAGVYQLTQGNLYMILVFGVLAVSSLQLLDSIRPRVSRRPQRA